MTYIKFILYITGQLLTNIYNNVDNIHLSKCMGYILHMHLLMEIPIIFKFGATNW